MGPKETLGGHFLWPGARLHDEGEKINQTDSSPEEPTTKICQKQAPIKPSEDQKVEEDPLEEKIHWILDDLEEVFC